MILRPHQVVDQLAPHFGSAAAIAAYVAAATAAASAAAQARQQAQARRQQQNAAQASKQGLASTGTPPPSVSSSAMDMLNTPEAKGAISKMLTPNAPTSAATAGSIQQMSPQEIANQGQTFQQFVGSSGGGQQMDFQQLLQKLQNFGGGMGG